MLAHDSLVGPGGILWGPVAEWVRATTGDRTVDGSSPTSVKTFRLGTLAIPFTPLCQGLVLSCTILCSTAFCRLSNDSQRRITQRIDVDGAAYSLHGQKLAGIAFNREWNNVGETASAAAAGNRFHSGMVRATNDPWSCAVTAPMARNLK